MKKIFIVEDDENIRELIQYALDANMFQAYGFESSQGFFVQIDAGNLPELIILDIMLPGMDGISILKQLKQSRTTSDIPIIMLTAKGNEYDKIKGLDMGADDYITKPFSVLELISRIKAVLRRGNQEIPTNKIIFKDIVLDSEKHTVKANGESVLLTYKEFELLKYLLANKGIALSREKIMECIWGIDFEGESRTVDMHIKTLRQKLGESGSLIETVRGIGYKIGE